MIATRETATDVTALTGEMDLLEEALQLAGSGFRVLPLHSPDPAHASGCSCHRSGCESPAKHPRTKHGAMDAIADDKEIRRWWTMWPTANIGIATGGGLVVLDVDPRHDGDSSLEELENEHGEIVTRTVRTGGGGLHLYFQGDLPARGAFRQGLDLKAAGGYVVAAGSRHASGQRYTWVDPGEGIRVVPEWLHKIINTSKSQNGPRGPLPDTIQEGGRNNALASLAGTMRRRGASEASILAALESENATRCVPPLPVDEVKAIAASVARYDPAVPVAELFNRNGPSTGKKVKAAGGVTLDDFYAYMPEHKYIFTPARELWPAASVNARVPPQGEVKAAAWLDKHQAVEQMTWAPGEPLLIQDRLVSHGGWIDRAGCACFNLYRAPTIKPGDADKAGPWLDHVHRIYPTEAEHIIAWLAHRRQRPDEKPNHAIVLGGLQGIGKDTLIEPVKHAVGPWNCQEVSPAHLIGRFNGFVKSVILRVSEARDLGDVDRFSFYDHMKAYTASPPDVLRCDEKNIREYSVLNVCGVVITTNHKADGIYLPADDRRHYVAWSELTKDDFKADYWRRLYGWYGDDGSRHVTAYLDQYDLSDFDPKEPPPKTTAFWDIVDANRAPEDAELADVIDKLMNPRAVTLRELAKQADQTFGEWLQDRKNSRKIPHRLEAAGYVPVRNDAAKSGLWVVRGKRQVVYAQRELPVRDRIEAVTRLVEGSRS